MESFCPCSDITGIHSVIFSTEGRQSAKSYSTNRDCFASGAFTRPHLAYRQKTCLYHGRRFSVPEIIGTGKHFNPLHLLLNFIAFDMFVRWERWLCRDGLLFVIHETFFPFTPNGLSINSVLSEPIESGELAIIISRFFSLSFFSAFASDFIFRSAKPTTILFFSFDFFIFLFLFCCPSKYIIVGFNLIVKSLLFLFGFFCLRISYRRIVSDRCGIIRQSQKGKTFWRQQTFQRRCQRHEFRLPRRLKLWCAYKRDCMTGLHCGLAIE